MSIRDMHRRQMQPTVFPYQTEQVAETANDKPPMTPPSAGKEEEQEVSRRCNDIYRWSTRIAKTHNPR